MEENKNQITIEQMEMIEKGIRPPEIDYNTFTQLRKVVKKFEKIRLKGNLIQNNK